LGLTVLPDSNVWIDLLRTKTAQSAGDQLETMPFDRPFLLSAVSRYELENGMKGRAAETSRRRAFEQLLSGPVLEVPFDAAAAVEASRIAAHARGLGRPLSATDAMIAGHAAALRATLLTGDARIREALPDDVATLTWVAPSQVARGGAGRP
jgi:predicted nucleic acid-binding protein